MQVCHLGHAQMRKVSCAAVTACTAPGRGHPAWSESGPPPPPASSNEIDMAGLAKIPGIIKTEIKPQVHEWTFPAAADGSVRSIIVLSEGRLLNLGNATGHPSY
jgi:S-adenosyl-L-homocysteine hydrolase, NAD binding domain